MARWFHVGKRVAALRARHGDSLRDAAERTGVSHSTIARIESGEANTNLHRTLRKIADGYGVTVEYLLTGRDPRSDFEASLRAMPPAERSRLYFASSLTRTWMVLQFLIAEYPKELPIERLAKAVSVAPDDLRRLLEEGEASNLPDEVVQRIGDGLSRLTGISLHWFRSGYLPGEQGASLPPETMDAYLRLIQKAALARVKPDVLEIAIDLLIMKQKEEVAATKEQPKQRNRKP